MKIPTLDELIGVALRTMVRRATYMIPRKVFIPLIAVIGVLYLLFGTKWIFFILMLIGAGPSGSLQ